MQTLRFQSAIAAGATLANVLAGSLVQYPQQPSVVRVAATVPAAATGDILMSLRIGGRLVAPDQVVPIEAAAGRGPDAQLGWMIAAPAMGNELLELVARNIDAANATTITWLVQVDPI